MRIDFLGRGVQIQSGPARIWLSSVEVLDLMRWCIDHEVELTAKVYEQERKQEQGEQPRYYIGQENGDE